MTTFSRDGNAIVYCEGSFNTPNGKTAHGLVRFTERYRVLSVVDARYAGEDAGTILDGKPSGIPIFRGIGEAYEASCKSEKTPTHLVIGLAPDGGRLSAEARKDVRAGIEMGLNIDSGLHDFLTEDSEFMELAAVRHVKIRDIRKPPQRDGLHFFSGKIEQVNSLKIAVLGTDSACGKRTTAWLLVQALNRDGTTTSADMIGTGQTSWMQGAKYSIIIDSLVNDFISGEIEHVIWKAWDERRPDVIVIEGQGSLMNPAYPGGFEILAAGRPDVVVLQHVPARMDYDGFPGYRIHPLSQQINAIETISGKPVVAVTISHENLPDEKVSFVCDAIQQVVGLPVFDVLKNGAQELAEIIRNFVKK